MLRTVAAPLMALVVAAWILVGILVAALLANALLTGLPDGDPRGGTLGAASVLMGVAVTLIGVSATLWAARRRAPRPAWPGGVAPNTLRGDVVRSPRPRGGGPASPVPSNLQQRPPWSSAPGAAQGGRSASPGQALRITVPPPSPGAPPASGPWAWPADGRHAAAPRRPTPIPGAQRVTSASAPGARPVDDRFVTGPRRGVGLPAVLSLLAGLVVAYALSPAATVEADILLIPTGLLLVGGAALARSPQPGTGRPLLRAAVLATVPPAVVTLAALVSGEADGTTAGMAVLTLFIGAWVVLGIGRAFGRAIGGLRGR